ncbi:ATP-binding protein [Streptomyces sp. NPDC059786]|uniref:ATP-binding protein n=1 Tax=Streptomyces sp. NPDC059786 TaxID=3346946 RepID=UPI00364E6AD2
MSDWGVCADTCDTAGLVVSELVTNAIVHTASRRVVCELHDSGDLVRIAVRDEGCAPGEPRPVPVEAEEEHGRGLLLVEAVCTAWGAQETGPGLRVWAELPRTAEAGAEDAAADAYGLADPADPYDAAVLDLDLDSGPDDDAGQDGDSGPAPASAYGTAGPAGAYSTAVPASPYDTAGPASPYDTGVPAGTAMAPCPGTAVRPAHPVHPARPDGRERKTNTEVRSDLGWSAKKPPADGRGSGAQAFQGTGAEWV